jgi:ectoine hydroxylase-related dioxygenase (phytanoyl-CoA dioxygenase family)
MVIDQIDYRKLRDEGFIKVNNFLNHEETNQTREIIQFYNSSKGNKETHFCINYKSKFLKLIKLDFQKIKDSNYLLNILEKKEINKISNKIFETKSYLSMIDGYCSPKSDKEVLPWHIDQAYNDKDDIKTIHAPNELKYKFFIFLTKVGPDNGCTSYIPGSHKITDAIRQGLYQKKIKYSPHWSLKNLRKFINKIENYNFIISFLKEEKLVKEFLEKTKFADSDLETNNFDYEAEAGDAIIFNEGGVHKGSKTSFSNRVVLRYLYSAKNTSFFNF